MAPRDPSAVSWEAERATLDDQRIFGPLRDFVCACGKYKGDRHRDMICDRCGVKITTREARRQRFGHISLPVALPHPFSQRGESLSAIPVLPADFWQAPAGSELAQAYDELVRSVTSGACKALAAGQEGLPEWTGDRCKKMLAPKLALLFDLLLPVATFAHEWELADSKMLARGLALDRRDSAT